MPNDVLAALMREGNIQNDQLARRVNAAGAELGLSLTYTKTAVSQWLKGHRPKREARPAVTKRSHVCSRGP